MDLVTWRVSKNSDEIKYCDMVKWRNVKFCNVVLVKS